MLSPASPEQTRRVVVVVAGALLVLVARPAVAIVIYENDFEDDPVGTYTVGNLAADWNAPPWNRGVDAGRVVITDDGTAYGGRSMVVTYPEGESVEGRSGWRLELGQGYEELFLSYRVRFDEGFDFVRGGKLPGLCGGTCNTGGRVPDGTDGWSARMMWRTNGSSGSFTGGDAANIVQYVYHPDQPGEFGENLRWDDGALPVWREFNRGAWRHVQHRVVMNTPGEPDGVLQAWLDGELVLDVRDLRYRDTATIQIDQMRFSTFFGGSSEVWEPSKDERASFDDFVVSTTYLQAGDYNRDGVVDGADYTAWRDTRGSSTLMAADGDGDGAIGPGDYAAWLAAYGATPPAAVRAVPEPHAVVLLLAAAAGPSLTRPGSSRPARASG